MTTSDKPAPKRQRTPDSKVFSTFMASSWADQSSSPPQTTPLAGRAQARRKALKDAFPQEWLIIPAGSPKTRSNDTDYPFRPHTTFTYLTAWGSDTIPGSLLILGPDLDDVVYTRGPAGRDSDEFYANAAIGEFWTGPRPSLADLAVSLGLDVLELADRPPIDLGQGQAIRVVRDADLAITEEVDKVRGDSQTGLDEALSKYLSEMRLVKDELEVAELVSAVEATARGFDDIIRALPDAVGQPRGERLVEGVFYTRARREGNDVGYGTIAASGAHACILHWVKNDGPVMPGDLLLVDAGVERDSLYTADITRTIPVGGVFTEVQRMVYEAVLTAADRAIAHIKPGVTFRSVHDEAMVHISEALDSWGFLPVSAAKSRQKDAGYHRRYMIHGTSHHLGLDVHDCAEASSDRYLDGVLEPGMVFTVEPGLYFQPDDLTVPEKWRGIGVRIEDDILVTDDGAVNLSHMIPRTPDDVEAWWTRLAGS